MKAVLRDLVADSMAVDVVREAWGRDPVAVLLSVPATLIALVAVYALLVVWLGAGTPA